MSTGEAQMNPKELTALDDAELVDLLSLAQPVMAGPTRTPLPASNTVRGENLGAALTGEAAKIIADMSRAEAAELREAGKNADADVPERAVAQSKMPIQETFRPPALRQ